MEITQTELEYAVGLSREEYVRSSQLVAATLQRKQVNGRRIISILLLLICAGMMAMNYRLTGTIEPGEAIIMTLMTVAELWMLFDLPRQQRRMNAAVYDSTLFSGHSFDGVLTVDERGVTKRTSDDSTRVEFAQCAAYVEAEDMLMFCVTNGRSIVVPARCLTPEDAEATKQKALAVIGPSKQYIVSELRPMLERRLPVGPLTVETEEVSVSVSVEYTAAELKGNMADTAIRAFFGKFPNKMLAGVLFTILFYYGMEVSPLPMFLSAMVVLFVMDMVSARLRTRRAIAASNGDVCRLTVELTERHVRVTGSGEKGRRIAVPWERITRAVERPAEVEFFTEDARVIVIPKRCILDMEALRTFVDAHTKQ